MVIENIKCSNCGAAVTKKVNGKYVCPFCGTEFVPKPVIDSPTDVNNDFEVVGGTLVKYNGSSLSPVLPESVVKIGAHAFSHCLISDITIPLSVTEIGQYAFEDCKELQTVYIPESVTKIGQRAFVRCFKLEKVEGAINVHLSADDFVGSPFAKTIFQSKKQEREQQYSYEQREQYTKEIQHKAGCYIATCVYGSYNCPQVWMLRRYRDFVLSLSVPGQFFIKFYYFVSPYMVKKFGDKKWFKAFFKRIIDKKIEKLSKLGYPDTPYKDLF